MEWTRDLDLELVTSFASGEMHNWFVFCRKYNMTCPESSARMDLIRENKEYHSQLRSEAEEILKGRQEQYNKNRARIKEIVEKGSPASVEDKEWMALNEW